MAQSEHRKQRCVPGLISEIILELTLCKFRTGCRLCRYESGVSLSREVMTHERECYSTEIGSSAETSYDNVRILSCHLHLLLSLKTDDCLMQGHMIHHRAEGIFASRCHACKLHSLRNRCSERSLMVWSPGKDILSGTCGHGRRRGHKSTEHLHDAFPVRLLLITNLDLIDGSLYAEDLGSIRKCCTPLSRTGLGSHVGHSFLLAVICLSKSGIELM